MRTQESGKFELPGKENGWFSRKTRDSGKQQAKGPPQTEPPLRSASAISGSLTDFDISHVLQMVAYESKTARLKLTSNGATARILFSSGRIVAATQNRRSFIRTVIHFLRREGILGPTEYRELAEIEDDTSVVLERLLRAHMVESRVVEQLAETWLLDAVTELLTWREGRYDLEVVTDNAPHEIAGVSLSYDAVVVEASRRADELQRLGKVISDQDVFVSSPNQRRRLRGDLQVLLLDFEGYLKSFLDGTMPVAVLCKQLFCTRYRVYEALAEMVRLEDVHPLGSTVAAAVNAATRILEENRTSRPVRVLRKPIVATAILCCMGAAVAVLLLTIQPALLRHRARSLLVQDSAHVRASIARATVQQNAQALTQDTVFSAETDSAPDPRQEKPQLPKKHLKAPRATRPDKATDPGELIASMERLLESKDYQAVLTTYAALAPMQATLPWPLICRMRALIALKRYDNLGLFFRHHVIDDGEFHAAYATHLLRNGNWRGALVSVRLAEQTAVKYTSSRLVSEDISYSKAVALGGIQKQHPGDDSARIAALEAWFQAKYAYRNEREHPRYIEANERIRELSGNQ